MNRPRWPGAPSELRADQLVAIGKILKPHGVRGEMSVEVLTDFPERYEETDEVHLIPPHKNVAREAPPGIWQLELETARPHHGRMLVKLRGVTTMDQVDWLRNWVLAVPEDELVELEEGEYWHFQLEGMTVVTPEGETLGKLREVLSTPAHDLYCVATAQGEVLIPAVAEYVLEVDLANRRMVVVRPELE